MSAAKDRERLRLEARRVIRAAGRGMTEAQTQKEVGGYRRLVEAVNTGRAGIVASEADVARVAEEMRFGVRPLSAEHGLVALGKALGFEGTRQLFDHAAPAPGPRAVEGGAAPATPNLAALGRSLGFKGTAAQQGAEVDPERHG